MSEEPEAPVPSDPVIDVLRQGCPLLGETSAPVVTLPTIDTGVIGDVAAELDAEAARTSRDWQRRQVDAVRQGAKDRKSGKVTIYSVLVTLLLFGSIGFAIWQNLAGGTWQGTTITPPPLVGKSQPASTTGGPSYSRAVLIKWLNGKTAYRLRPSEVEEARAAIKADGGGK